MPNRKPTLHLMCGKIAAGKSTLAAKLAAEEATILIVEDEWLSALYSEEMSKPKDFVRCAAKLRKALAPHIVSLLETGISVVLDFQANTVESRAWMRNIIRDANSDHQLHVLTPPDEVCLERLAKRNASGEHPFSVSEEQFRQISQYFTHPTPDEGFNLTIYDQT